MPEITAIVSTVGAWIGGLATNVLGYVFGRVIKRIVVKYSPRDANETSSPSSIDRQFADLTNHIRALDYKITNLGQGAEAETAKKLLTAVERIADQADRIANQADQRSSWELTMPPIVVNRRPG